MTLEHINPAGVATPTNYTHVIATQGGRTVYVSGQTPVNVKGEVVGDDLTTQAVQVFENLKACLAAAGATFNDVVKTTTFIVNFQPEQRALLGEVRTRYLPADKPTTSTLLGVQALARPEFIIEIEAIAVVR